MSHTITIKLNKAAHEFKAGESTGFGVRGGVKYFDRKSKSSEWTNYQAVVFAKAPAQIDFYRNALVEGSIVEVTGKQQKIEVYEGQSGQQISIELLDASLGFIGTPGQSAPQRQPAQAPSAANQLRQGVQQLGVQQQPVDDFDDSAIPF